MSSEPETYAGQLFADRYELSSQIAEGGMGTVWEARDTKLGRKVALKVMRRRSMEAFTDARERFEREARAVAALHSAHVVQVHDYGVSDGLPFFAMELLTGNSLKERLADVGAMDINETALILRQVAKGLKAAHRAGLVHRDLKPSNIFLAQRDDLEVVKLLDFGVVKSTGSRDGDETASGVLLGTPQYMSPEQARGLKAIDERSDLWSLAVILYTMLVGQNPFDSVADAVGDIVIRVCIDPITPPSVMNPDVPPPLDDFFEQAFEREPEDRFQTIDGLTEAFMLAADVSWTGLDPAMGSGSSYPRPNLPGITPLAGIGSGSSYPKASRPDATLPSPGGKAATTRASIDDPLSSSPMSTTLGGTPRASAQRRTVAIVAAVAIMCVGLGFGAHALLKTDGASGHAGSSATGSTSSPTALGSAPSATPPASASTSAVAKPSSSSSSQPPSSGQPPQPSLRPTSPPPPPATTEPSDKPPTWYVDKKKKDT